MLLPERAATPTGWRAVPGSERYALDATLGAALQPGANPLRRNYFGMQLRNGSDEKLRWNLRYSRCLDDHGAQLVGQLSYDQSDHVPL